MTSQTDQPTEALSAEPEGPLAEVVDLWKWRTGRDASPEPQAGTSRTSSMADDRYAEPGPRAKLRRARPTPLDTALMQIAAARELAGDPIERSNAFDAWRDTLHLLSKSAGTATPEFREILGLLLAAVQKRDLPHLSPQLLGALQDSTARLKSRPAAIDVGRVSANLRSAGATTTLQLATDGLSAEALQELESIIEAAKQNRG